MFCWKLFFLHLFNIFHQDSVFGSVCVPFRELYWLRMYPAHEAQGYHSNSDSNNNWLKRSPFSNKTCYHQIQKLTILCPFKVLLMFQKKKLDLHEMPGGYSQMGKITEPESFSPPGRDAGCGCGCDPDLSGFTTGERSRWSPLIPVQTKS